jgi:hypothetical protein
MYTAPRHQDCAEWERDVTDGGWSADCWVDEARKFGASYIVLATFHSRLGYARPWPSKIPGSSAGITNCSACSGGRKVRNIGGDPGAFVRSDNVTVDEAKRYTLYIDFTVNGPRSFFVTVNGGAPVEVKVDGAGNNTQYTTSVPVDLNAGANTIKLHNDRSSAPDLDRLALGSPA